MLNLLTRYHKLLSIVIALSVIGSIFLLRNGITIDNSLETWFVHNDKVYDNYIDFRERYANDEVVAIYVRSGNVFSPVVIEKMVAMCSQIDSLESVKSVFYLANAPYISSSFFGPVVTPLINTLPRNDDDVELLKSKIEKVTHYKNILIDKKSEGFMAFAMLYPSTDAHYSSTCIEQIQDVSLKHFEKVHFGGIPVVNKSLNETADKESRKLSVLSILAVFALLMIFLRNWRYVFISVLAVLIPVVWLFSGYVYFGGTLNMITVIIPTILLITGTATSIHIINICHRFIAESHDVSPSKSLVKALKYVFWPCFFTATTTMAGFISLVASPIDGIQEVGILSAIGVGLVFICSFVVTPIAILLFPSKRINAEQSLQLSSKSTFVLDFINTLNRRFPRLALILFPATIALSIALMWKIGIGTNTFDYLDKRSSAYADNFIIENEVGPFMPVELLITKDSSFNATDLHNIFRFQKELNKSGIVSNVFSPLDIMVYLNQTIYGVSSNQLPAGKGSTEWVKNLYLKNRNKGFQRYDNEDFTEMRISANTLVGTSAEYSVKQEKIIELFGKTFGDRGISLSVRGYMPMYVAMNNHIINGQIKTFLIAFTLILFLIVICFKSLKLALLALTPNLFPISLVLLAMYFLQIPIDQSTALITCVILGIAFDDSIHLIYSYRNHQRLGFSSSEATNLALQTTASAMISTSIALFAGFIIIATMSVAGLMYFGILCSIAVVGSILGNIWLFPVQLKKIK